MELVSFIKEGFSKREETVKKIKKLETSGNLSFIIFTNKSKYILRLCGTKERYRTYKELLSEVELLKFQLMKGLSVPNPIKLNNQLIILTNKGNGICYEYLEGEVPKNHNLTQYFLVGKILGKIHNLTVNFKYPYERKPWNLETCKKKFQEVKEELSKEKCLQNHRFTETVEYILNNLDFPNSLPRGVIHEDLGKRHVLFQGNKISGVLDWDRCYYGYLIHDLGQTIRGWCFENWNILNKEKFLSILEGYENQRKLTPLEKDYLLNAVKFAFIERALSFAINFLNRQKKEDLEFAIQNLRLIQQI